MTPIPINLAVEDLLSEAVARKLLLDSGNTFLVGTVFNRGGNGYLRKTVKGWNSAAKSVPFFLLTDLDNLSCPLELINSWLPNSANSNLIFRVAVREVESWLLADQANFATFLGISPHLVPLAPDRLDDPKAALIDLARKSSKSVIKSRIVPKNSSTAKQGRDYNGCLIDFVGMKWDSTKAAQNSPSLERCKLRIEVFRPTWQSST